MKSNKLKNLEFAVKTGSANISNAEMVIKSFRSLAEKNAFLQLVSLKPVASKAQILFALEQAFDAFERKANFSKSRELEFLLRLTGLRQINRALDLLELRKGMNEVAIVASAKDKKLKNRIMKEAKKIICFKEDKKAIEKNLKKNKKHLMKVYSVSEKELKALEDCKNPLGEAIIEKIAMLSLEE